MFGEIERQGAFDGVWVCAPLLHVSEAESPVSISALVWALLPVDVMY